jgi:hypothetical protein
MKLLKRFPSVLLLLIVWAVFRLGNIADFSTGVGLMIFVALVLGSISFEFFKSGDITLLSFGWDMSFAIIATIMCSVVETILIMNHSFALTDILTGLVVLMDGWFSPFNSFRTALRNFQVASSGS